MRGKMFFVIGLFLLAGLLGYVVWGLWQLKSREVVFETRVSLAGVSGFEVDGKALNRDLQSLRLGRLVYKTVEGASNGREVEKIIFELVGEVEATKIRLRGRGGRPVAGLGWEMEAGEERVRIYLDLAAIEREEAEASRLAYWAVLNAFERLGAEMRPVQERIDDLVKRRAEAGRLPVAVRRPLVLMIQDGGIIGCGCRDSSTPAGSQNDSWVGSALFPTHRLGNRIHPAQWRSWANSSPGEGWRNRMG